MPHYLCTNVLFICSSVLFHVLCIMYMYVNRQLNSREYDQLPHLILSQLMMMDFVVDGQVCAYVFFDTLSHRYTTFLDCVFVCRPIAILFFLHLFALSCLFACLNSSLFSSPFLCRNCVVVCWRWLMWY